MNVVVPSTGCEDESAVKPPVGESPDSICAVKPGVGVVTVRCASFTGLLAARTSPTPRLSPPNSSLPYVSVVHAVAVLRSVALPASSLCSTPSPSGSYPATPCSWTGDPEPPPPDAPSLRPEPPSSTTAANAAPATASASKAHAHGRRRRERSGGRARRRCAGAPAGACAGGVTRVSPTSSSAGGGGACPSTSARQAFSSLANAVIEGKRCAGSFASARSTAASSLGGTSGGRARRLGAVSLT